MEKFRKQKLLHPVGSNTFLTSYFRKIRKFIIHSALRAIQIELKIFQKGAAKLVNYIDFSFNLTPLVETKLVLEM